MILESSSPTPLQCRFVNFASRVSHGWTHKIGLKKPEPKRAKEHEAICSRATFSIKVDFISDINYRIGLFGAMQC